MVSREEACSLHLLCISLSIMMLVCVSMCVICVQQNFQGGKILSISQKYGVNHLIFLMQIYENLNFNVYGNITILRSFIFASIFRVLPILSWINLSTFEIESLWYCIKRKSGEMAELFVTYCQRAGSRWISKKFLTKSESLIY